VSGGGSGDDTDADADDQVEKSDQDGPFSGRRRTRTRRPKRQLRAPGAATDGAASAAAGDSGKDSFGGKRSLKSWQFRDRASSFSSPFKTDRASSLLSSAFSDESSGGSALSDGEDDVGDGANPALGKGAAADSTELWWRRHRAR
jgi:hypothetical protein